MSKWLHIDFWFEKGNTWRKDSYLNQNEKKDFEDKLCIFLKKVRPYIIRKFYLYEDIPHCFLAIELKDRKNIPLIDNIREKVFVAPYIYKSRVNKEGNDEGNGKGFLDILNAFTDFYLFHKDQCITHIIHCCMEFMMQSRQKECEFYQNMAVLYQVVKVKDKKIVYGLKRFDNKIRTKLKKHINKLDLRKCLKP